MMNFPNMANDAGVAGAQTFSMLFEIETEVPPKIRAKFHLPTMFSSFKQFFRPNLPDTLRERIWSLFRSACILSRTPTALTLVTVRVN